jgi:3-isopropylmalate/(R)-2-methylmalate dehydratase small subunit
VDGILDVDWEITSLEDTWVIKEAAIRGFTYEDQMRELAKRCLTRVDPLFPTKVRPGDFLVGNRGVGWGHDHDQAVLALKGLRLAAVVCEKTTVNFRRNCLNHGLPIVEVAGVFDEVKGGDELELDLRTGTLKNLTTGHALRFAVYPDFILDLLDAGGIYPQLKERIAAKNHTS